MTGRPISLCVVIIVIVLTACRAVAQQEQLLTYRTPQDSKKTARKGPGQTIRLTDQKPEGVKLPAFSAATPLFGKWKTPMVKAGYLLLAVDRSDGNGPYNRLFIDSDGDGSLVDETPVEAPRSRRRRRKRFGPVKVALESKAGPVAYHLNFVLHKTTGDSKTIKATSIGWCEGNVIVAGKKCSFAVFDSNANGVFGDSDLDFTRSDRIAIGSAGGRIRGWAGKYIQIDETLYRLDITRNGTCVKFHAPEKGCIGSIRVPEGVSRLSAGGENGLLFVSARDGVARLPAGRYRLNHWELDSKDKSGASWNMCGAEPAEAIVFDVSKKTQASLNFGEPVLGSISIAKKGDKYILSNPGLAGRHGERISVTRNGRRPPAPGFRIRNVDGSYDKSFKFEYG